MAVKAFDEILRYEQQLMYPVIYSVMKYGKTQAQAIYIHAFHLQHYKAYYPEALSCKMNFSSTSAV